MKEVLQVLGVALLLAVVVLVAAGTAGAAGAAIGLFLGAILWAVEWVAGPLSSGRGDAWWWILGAFAVVALLEAIRAWEKRRAFESSGHPSGSTPSPSSSQGGDLPLPPPRSR